MVTQVQSSFFRTRLKRANRSSGFYTPYNPPEKTKTILKDNSLSDLKNNFPIYKEAIFLEMLSREAMRTYRSQRSFCIISINISKLIKQGVDREEVEKITRWRVVNKIIEVLHTSTREIDVKGWIQQNRVIGILCVEIEGEDHSVISEKIQKNIDQSIDKRYAKLLTISVKSFPDKNRDDKKTRVFSLKDLGIDHHKDTVSQDVSKKRSLTLKRCIDIVGSIVGILLFSPFFLIIPILIKLTSKGPVLFKQERVGEDGKTFNFLKFRSMYINNDSTIHKQFITQLINGEIRAEQGPKKNAYKIKNDPRITKIGKFIRKTSLDELPQFLNVLRGDMSLVGPRPPIPYEVEKYDIWHTRRVLNIKPGITGLWQVEGRSSTTFDAMVRMDLQYIKNWSLWFDIKLLFKTPFVVFAAKGAC